MNKWIHYYFFVIFLKTFPFKLVLKNKALSVSEFVYSLYLHKNDNARHLRELLRYNGPWPYKHFYCVWPKLLVATYTLQSICRKQKNKDITKMFYKKHSKNKAFWHSLRRILHAKTNKQIINKKFNEVILFSKNNMCKIICSSDCEQELILGSFGNASGIIQHLLYLHFSTEYQPKPNTDTHKKT